MTPCNCRICNMTRRRRELDKAPTIEGYQAYCDDLSEIWINESFEADIEIINLRERLETDRATASAKVFKARPPVAP